jgi:glycosyltransferase involved in cell wall biosynthesis
MNLKISIITVVYNNRQNIEDCIKSVLSQTYLPFEYIIIDGGSTDGTIEKIYPYKEPFINVISERDGGMYDALNKGIRIASGDIVGILHSDDVFENDTTLFSIAEVFDKKGPDCVYGDLVYVDKMNVDKLFRYWKSTPFNITLLKKGWMPPHPTMFLKKQIFETLGGYNTAYKIAADYDFILRIFSRAELKFEYLPQVITRMRTGGASNRSFLNIIRKSWEDYSALKKNKAGGIITLALKNFNKIEQFFHTSKSK